MIIDVHTHAFPDALAPHAMAMLEGEGDVKAVLDGTVGALLSSMDRAGIDRSVVLSIATKPSQFGPILSWSKSIASDRLLPFPSVHPASPRVREEVRRIGEEGFRGIKLHPYYQDFYIDGEEARPVFEAAAEQGLLVVCHTGFDIAFERVRRADPVRVARLLDAVPGLQLVATHFGAWEDWDEVRARLVGRRLYIEISYSFEFMSDAAARDILERHPAELLLFGTDSPWADQAQTLARLRGFGLDPAREAAICGGNAERLLAFGVADPFGAPKP